MMSRGQHTATPTLMLTISFRQTKGEIQIERRSEMKINFYGLTGTFFEMNFYFHVACCVYSFRVRLKFHFGAQKLEIENSFLLRLSVSLQEIFGMTRRQSGIKGRHRRRMCLVRGRSEDDVMAMLLHCLYTVSWELFISMRERFDDEPIPM